MDFDPESYELPEEDILVDDESFDDDEDGFLSDVEADADALASGGLGTDEDYFNETPLGELIDGGGDFE